MTLHELIEALEAEEHKHIILSWGFEKPHSYRGYYECVAFEPIKNSIQNMLDEAKYALGRCFDGWKGGEFYMQKDTEVYIALEGCTGILLTYNLFNVMMNSAITKP